MILIFLKFLSLLSDLVFSSDVQAGPSTLVLPYSTVSSSSPTRAMKPPITRVRLAAAEQMTQHDLSVIQEVETPANVSQAAGSPLASNITSRTTAFDQ